MRLYHIPDIIHFQEHQALLKQSYRIVNLIYQSVSLKLPQFHHRGDALDYSILAVGVRLVGCLEIDTEYTSECLPEPGTE